MFGVCECIRAVATGGWGTPPPRHTVREEEEERIRELEKQGGKNGSAGGPTVSVRERTDSAEAVKVV